MLARLRLLSPTAAPALAALLAPPARCPPPMRAVHATPRANAAPLRRVSASASTTTPPPATAPPPPPPRPPSASVAPDFAPRATVKSLFGADGGVRLTGTQRGVRGWVRTCRAQKARAFLEVSDGSTATGLQVVIEPGTPGWEDVEAGRAGTGAAVAVDGVLVESKGGRQAVELKAASLTVVGECDAGTYPLQKKRHTPEYLRTVAHLRPRTRTHGATLRVRSALAAATHEFYQAAGFAYVHTPVITAADCEGAGEAFQVTTLLAAVDAALAAGAPPSDADLAAADAAVSAAGGAVRASKEAGGGKADPGALAALAAAKEAAEALRARAAALAGPARSSTAPSLDYGPDFFGARATLTVSGQLQAEAAACALGDVYTFGPTFRAENSNTARHLAEFWMIEPEMAFAGLPQAMSTCEAHVRFAVRAVLDRCADDVAALDAASPGLADALTRLAATRFHTVTYNDAVRALMASGRAWEFEPAVGEDLAAEHERWITDVLFGGDPVFVTDWPADIKAFYMRLNDDGRTVAAMDLLVPRVGELAGGSAREERPDVLASKMDALGVDAGPLWWYADLRRYGSVPHAGFGVGFERLVQLATGADNIRDTTLFPRYPGHADF